MVVLTVQGRSFSMDNRLYKDMQNIKAALHKKDRDWVGLVDGNEGAGKSVLAQQICSMMDPTFTYDRMCQTPAQFIDAVNNADKYQAVCFDEAFRGLGSRSALSDMNRKIVDLMMRMRQRNLFVLLVLPTVFMLDKYALLWRAKGLWHTYEKKDKRGFWTHFNRRKMRMLYDFGKKYYSYKKPETHYYGRFYDQYIIDEVKYRKFKSESLVDVKVEKKSKYIDQRDSVLRAWKSSAKISNVDMIKLIAGQGLKLSESKMSTIVSRKA